MKLTDSRRWTGRFLTALAILVLVFSSGLNQSALAQNDQGPKRQNCDATDFLWDDSITADQSWVTPPVLQANDGTSDFTVNLIAEKVPKTVDTLFKKCPLYSYRFSCGDNCQQIGSDWDEEIPVGPTIKVKPGDILHVDLQNNLMGTTNLHTHGLHVSPNRSSDDQYSDNVLLEIGNGESQNYTFEIPRDHYPGTFWYHPHHHGTTAAQVEDGMAGALIVEDPTDGSNPYPSWVKEAEDRIFLLQQIPFTKKYNTIPIPPKKISNITINGVLNPIIEMKPGALERWRFIHTGEDESIPIDFRSLISNNYKFKLIALDGVTFHYPRDIQDLELYPGYRADVIVKAPLELSNEPSLLKIKPESVVRLFGGPEARLLGRAEARFPSPIKRINNPEQRYLATVINTPSDSISKISIPDYDDNSDLLRPMGSEPLEIEDDKMTNTRDDPRKVRFNMKGTIRKVEYSINGKQYPEDQDQKFCLKKGESEFWELTSDMSAHPFHIHVNAFQVVDPGDSGTTIGDWHDTIIVKANTDPVIIKTRYDDFDGPFVLHCHILHHEDGGMMSLVEITNNDGECNNLSSTSED